MTPLRIRLFARALTLAGVALTFATLSSFSQVSAADPAVAEIRKAWRDRQSKVRSARVEWKSQFWFDQDVRRDRERRDSGEPIFYGPDGKRALKPAKEEPASVVEGYIETAQSNVLVLDGQRVRLENRGTQIRTSDTILPFEWLHVTSGGIRRQLNLSLTMQPWPEGQVFSMPDNRMGTMGDELWHWAFRPLVDEALLDAPGFEMAGTILLNEHEYAVVRRRGRSHLDEYWLDPAKQFAIVQVVTEQNGKPHILKQIEYQHQMPENLWIPAKWTREQFNTNDTTRYSMEQSQVTRCELNLELPLGTFELEFAPGTIVSDSREEAEGYDKRAKCAQYLVLPDGSKKFFTSKERDAVYEQLMKPAAAPR